MAPSLRSLATALLLASTAPMASAVDLIRTQSLNPCQPNNMFSATLFDVVFTPNNGSLEFNVNGVSTISGNATLQLTAYAYGLTIYNATLDPCTQNWNGVCPFRDAPIQIHGNYHGISADQLSSVPSIAYTVPDLDAKVEVHFISTTTGESLACVEAYLSNGKTVDQKAVSWVLAVIAGLALVASAITSGLGHSNAAAHVASNALSLFGYFQAQAFIGMTGVAMPPIVESWTQNMQWTMGIINVDFLQTIATWYQRATGGTPSEILSNLDIASVEVLKRSLDTAARSVRKYIPLTSLVSRATNNKAATDNVVVVSGIERVGFREGIEPTNIFLTGYIFLIIFVVLVVLAVVIFKLICEGLVKAGRFRHDQFQDFRNGWTTVLKGIMYRIVLIAFPQMVVLCFWEFQQVDSSAEVVLAVFTVFTIMGILAWASSKVIRLARRSISMHKNPAYILYSDPVALNKWGFLYVQFKATAYFFVVPVLIYILTKGLFVAFGQHGPVVQAVGFVVIEAIFLVLVCVLTPYMDRKTNAFNISICVINFISAIFLLFFTNVFNQPGIVTGVMGVVFFVYNAVFSTVLLVLVLIASGYAIFAKNPDTRYQPMRDDRSSFIKSSTQLNTELDALGATARGETKQGYSMSKNGARIDEDDDDSWSGQDSTRQSTHQLYSDAPHSPNMPSYTPTNDSGRHLPPTYHRPGAVSPFDQSRAGSMTSQSRFRNQNVSPSPWQRGAGYE